LRTEEGEEEIKARLRRLLAAAAVGTALAGPRARPGNCAEGAPLPAALGDGTDQSSGSLVRLDREGIGQPHIINSLARDEPLMETFEGVIPFLLSDAVRAWRC